MPLRRLILSLTPTCLPSCLFETRRLLSTPPPHLLFPALLNRCSHLNTLRQLHAFMLTRALHHDTSLLTFFLHTCSFLGFSLYAYSVFHHAPHPSIYLYNTMIRLLSRADSILGPLPLYNQLRADGFSPDTYTFPFLLKAVARFSAIRLGAQIHCQTLPTGLDSDVHVVIALVRMYSSCGCLADAHQLFDRVNFRNAALWNAMIAGYAKFGEVDKARDLLEHMPQRHRNAISWTCVISGYAHMDRPNEAIHVFRIMQLENVEPDEIAMLAVLSACANLGALQLGEWIHHYINNQGLNRTVHLNNALIDMYAKSGKIRKALQVFENMKNKSVVTWTIMISGLALHGLGREAIEMFFHMQRAGVRPNDISFIAILSACAHVGLVELCIWCFNAMKSTYGIEPKVEHYGCLIDSLGRAGFLLEAQELVRRMPFEANAAIWGSLLAASNIHGELELGICALRHLIELEPYNSGNYALLCNTYSSLGRWDESRMVRKMMRNKDVKKMPGGSFIEVNNRVYEFIAGDTSNPEFSRIEELLCEVDGKLKMTEYPRSDNDGSSEFDME